MNFGIDEYANLESPLHRWDPRFKLIGLLALIFAFSFVQDLRILPAMLLITALIYGASRLPVSFMLTRLRYPSFFLLVVVILLPFLSGEEVIANIGPFDIKQEGLVAVLLIATRFLCILTIGLVIFGTTSFLINLKAMRALGLPAILTDMALLTFRYIHEIGGYLHRMKTAMRLRGFRSRHFSLKGVVTLAWLGGSILVRSYERSEWIYRAMITRGYGHGKSNKDEFKAGYTDILTLALVFFIASGFITGEVLI